MQIYEPDSRIVHPIDAFAHYSGVPRHRIGVHCKHGVVGLHGNPGLDGWQLDESAIRALRRAEQLHERLGLNQTRSALGWN